MPNCNGNLVRVILYVALFVLSEGQNLDIPIEFVQEMLTMLLGTIDVFVSGCDAVNVTKLEYLFYAKQQPEKLVKLDSNNLKDVSSKVPTKIVLHGWFGSAYEPSAGQMREAYFKKGDYNLIFVDWGRQARSNYAQAVCSVTVLGEIIGDFLVDLHDQAGVDFKRVHLVGHSLGAHLAGFAGQRVLQRTGQKVSRITGLDAAGPGFLGFPPDRRLDTGDAIFVDGIHTNGAQFGYARDYGHVDFYPNCGMLQPACLDVNLYITGDVLRQTMENLPCSHNLSVQYFIESINSNKFVGTRFNSCNIFGGCPRGPKKSRTVMGEDTPVTAKGSYCVDTRSRSPYALG